MKAALNIACYDWVLAFMNECTGACEIDSDDADCDCDGGVLHAAPQQRLHEFDNWDGDPVESSAACGVGYKLSIPGVGSRLCLPRCSKCCELTGLPEGVGSPKNDDRCRMILGMN